MQTAPDCELMRGALLLGFALLGLAGCADEEGSEVKTHDPGSPPIEIVTDQERSERQGPPTAGEATATAPVAATAAYIARADRICGRHRPRIRALEKEAQAAADRGSFAAAAESLGKALAESEREISALRDLAVPTASEAALDRMYTGIEASNRLFRAALDELRAGDVEAFNSTTNQARLASFRSRRIAASVGFEVCGRD